HLTRLCSPHSDNEEELMTYAAGTVVMLKSGGQAMTVVSTSDDEVTCIWLGDEGDLFRETIPAIALDAAIVADEHEDEEDEHDEEGHDEEHDEDEEEDEDDEDDDKKTKSKKKRAA